MKKTVLLSSILLTSIFAFDLKSIATEVGKNIPSTTNQSQNKSNLDNSTISSGLKEALKSGVTFATTHLGKKDGFLNNKDLRLNSWGPFISWRQPLWREWFYVQGNLNYMNDHRDDRSHFISTSIRFEALF